MTNVSLFDEHVMAPVPAWVDALVEVVRTSILPLGFIANLGYRLWEPAVPANTFDGWMLAVYPMPCKVVGGSEDGALAVSGFELKVHQILKSFNPVEDLAWKQPHGYNGDLDGPELAIQGHILGKHVLLRVYHLPPHDEVANFAIDVVKGEVWRCQGEQRRRT